MRGCLGDESGMYLLNNLPRGNFRDIFLKKKFSRKFLIGQICQQMCGRRVIPFMNESRMCTGGGMTRERRSE
jgi:hypothetical protein